MTKLIVRENLTLSEEYQETGLVFFQKSQPGL